MKSLKRKMEITTLVQYADGRIGIVFLNSNSSDNKGIFIPGYGCTDYLSRFNDDLTRINGDKSREIIKIRFPKGNDNFSTVERIFGKSDLHNIDWDWERKKDQVTKDVSIEELNAILKEKFPDVDEFNLPIKERNA